MPIADFLITESLTNHQFEKVEPVRTFGSIVENNFQVGDTVRCIIGLGGALREGKEYVVTKVSDSYLYFNGSNAGWLKHRFEKAAVGTLGFKVRTGSGYLDLNNPDLDKIKIEDIAAALSKICRFSGQCPKFYSVAEHCIHVATWLQTQGRTKDCIKAGLLHDAAEAYLGDLITPMKPRCPEYGAVEDKLQSLIFKKFGVSDFGHVVKNADNVLLKAEKTRFWPDDQEQWTGLSSVPEWRAPIRHYMPAKAEKMFLDFFVNCC